MFERRLDIVRLLKRKSFFLFGPRSTGKTTLIQQQLPNAKVYDLLDANVFQIPLKHPKLIEEEYEADQHDHHIVVIDEIQKLPSLLDEVHRLIQKKKMTFLLTGSSARKLRHGGANLLAGRAWEASLFPLSYSEIPQFNLMTYLNHGGLPQIYGKKKEDVQEELQSYVGSYLREEIQAEAVTRNIQAFAEFLDLIALSNGQEINYDQMASDCQVSPGTLKNYLQILEDTLLGFKLPGFIKTKKRKAISRAKHYLFDIGITNQLCRRGEIFPKSELFGAAFEHFIILELRAFLSYHRLNYPLTYWRAVSQQEVDVIVGDKWAIEIKGTPLVQSKNLKGLLALKEENFEMRYIIVSLDQNKRKTQEGIEIWPWENFLKDLWNLKIIN